MRYRWRAGLVPVVVLLAIFAAACGSTEKASSGGADDAATASTADIPIISSAAAASPTVSGDATAAPAAKTVPQGGRVKGLMESDINTWDGTDYYAYAWMVDFITCNTLVGYPSTSDPVKNLELRPELAQGYTVSDDQLTYTFTLREGVEFSDGRPVTGADVKGSFLRALDPAAAFQVFGTVYYDAIAGVPGYKKGTSKDIPGITVDGNTVTFTLTERNGGFLNALALGFACIVPADAPHQKTNLPPPMTGPYVVTEHTQGKSLTIDRNPRWEHNRSAGIPEDPDTNNVDGWDVTIGVPPDAQVLQLKNGQADVSFDQTCCIGAVANDLGGDPQTKGRFFPVASLRISYATINSHVPPFDKLEVRQAVNYAVDREAVIKLLGGDVQASPSSGILADTLLPPGFDGKVYPSVPDIERATALMQQSGVATPVEAGTLYYPEAGVNADIAQQITSDLDKIGIQMKIKGLNTDNYYQFIQNPRNKDAIAIAAWEADYPDGITYFQPLLVSGAADGGSNYGDYKDPQLDAAVAKINELAPGAERRQAWAELSNSVARDKAPWIVFLTRNNLNLTSARFGGYHYDAVKTFYLSRAYLQQ